MNIDHIGIAVRSTSKAIQLFEKVFGYHQATKTIENTRQKVKVTFLEKDNSLRIKLIEPSCPDSPAVAALKKGQALHHICFKCEDMNGEIVRLQDQGCRLLVEPQPGEAFENEDISFLFAGLGLNIELIDTDKKAGRIDQE